MQFAAAPAVPRKTAAVAEPSHGARKEVSQAATGATEVTAKPGPAAAESAESVMHAAPRGMMTDLPAPPAAGEANPAPAPPQIATAPIATAAAQAAPPAPGAVTHAAAPPAAAQPVAVETAQLRVTPHSSELRVSVQLAELGKVEVRAVSSRDVTTAHLTASGHEALQSLAAGRSGLEDTLRTHDVLLGSMEARSQSEEQRHPSQPFAQPQNSSSPAAPAETPPRPEEDDESRPLPANASISIRV